MRALLNNQRFFIKKLKNVGRESWVEQPKDTSVPFLDRDLSHLNIKYYRDSKKDIQTNINPEQVKPISPKMGPYTVDNPKIYNKKYRWCSCGGSLTQPFCDGSHEGTNFQPFKFTIEENVKRVQFCGCKLTSNKPFCDGTSCKGEQDK